MKMLKQYWWVLALAAVGYFVFYRKAATVPGTLGVITPAAAA